MNSVVRALTLLAALFVALLPMAPAQAQAISRTWVTGVGGSDGNPCTITSPCATFAGAYAKTTAFGEINCLIPGSFGPVTITQSISIVCDPDIAHIAVGGGGIGITVNVGATDEVTLRGIDIDGLGTGGGGISFLGGGTLHVSQMLIRNQPGDGILFSPNTGTGKLDVSDDTVISNCGATAMATGGIRIRPQAGSSADATIVGAQLQGNGNGILVDATNGPVNLHVRDTIAVSNNFNGISLTTPGTHAGATIDHSTFVFNNNGVSVNGSGAIAIIGSSLISGNVTVGVSVTGGATLLSSKDNHIGGNVSDGTPITAFAGPGGQPLQ